MNYLFSFEISKLLILVFVMFDFMCLHYCHCFICSGMEHQTLKLCNGTGQEEVMKNQLLSNSIMDDPQITNQFNVRHCLQTLRQDQADT